jgi:hypothetical protein
MLLRWDVLFASNVSIRIDSSRLQGSKNDIRITEDQVNLDPRKVLADTV